MKKRQRVRNGLLIVTFLLFPAIFYYLSPYLIIDGTTKGIVTGSFIYFSMLLLSSLILGRACCGWICPASGIQDIIMQVNNRKITKGNLIKWILWIPWIATIVLLSIKNEGYYKIDPFYQTEYGLSMSNVFSLITYLLVLIIIVLPSFIFGRRSFCHSLCWMSPFMILGRKLCILLKLPSLRLISHNAKCIKCHTCTENCPMSLPVEQFVAVNKMENTECILCGTCVDGCKSNAIEFDFSNRKN